MRRRFLLCGLLGLFALVGVLGPVSGSSATTRAGSSATPPASYVYWTNSNAGTIGRANLDGTSPNPSFITGATYPYGVAVDGSHVYWPNVGSNTIGRANLDGTSPNESFISGAHAAAAAVDAGHIYWANVSANTIGRANRDGTGVDPSFITVATGVFGVAVDAGHVYWTNLNAGTIGRANLNGTSPDESFITGASSPYAVAVDAGHVYWTNYAASTIGRANLGGTGVDQSFITGADHPYGVAVDGGHVYWTMLYSGTIGRANLDGTNINPSFMSGGSALGVAVDPRQVARLRAGTTTCNGKYAGTGLKVVVPSGASCTLVPGTHVKSNVTVSSGGSLYIEGVRIGGTLTVSGSASVCASKIHRAVVPAGASVTLGYPACVGKTVIPG